MSVSYDTSAPTSVEDLNADLANNPSISSSTAAAISALIAPPGAETVVLGTWDGTGAIQAPVGENPNIIVVDIAASATPVTVTIPADVMNVNQAWVFDTDTATNVRFNSIERVIQMGNGSDNVVVTGNANTTIDGGGGNDAITTFGGNDSVGGSNGNDVISTGAGDDTIGAVLNFDTIDGGSGYDVLQLTGTADQWTVSVDGSVVTLNSTTATGASTAAPINAEVQNVEFVQFVDVAVAERAQFSLVITDTTNNSDDVMRLYQTTLDRSADQTGAEYWLDEAQTGQVTVEQAAAGFMASDEFSELWGDIAGNNGQFINQIYLNAFDRLPEFEGYEFWLDAIDSGAVSAAEFVAFVASSTEAETSITNVIVVGDIV